MIFKQLLNYMILSLYVCKIKVLIKGPQVSQGKDFRHMLG